MEDVILKAIIEANKLGAKGLQVTGYTRPATASEPPDLKLIATIPRNGTASELAWYDK